jgi:hypothetical protein
MRSRVAEEQAPGYPTRWETLTELQEGLTGSLPKRQMQITSATHGSHPRDGSNKQRTSLVSSDSRTSRNFRSSLLCYRGLCRYIDDTKTQAKRYQQEDQKRGFLEEQVFSLISRK